MDFEFKYEIWCSSCCAFVRCRRQICARFPQCDMALIGRRLLTSMAATTSCSTMPCCLICAPQHRETRARLHLVRKHKKSCSVRWCWVSLREKQPLHCCLQSPRWWCHEEGNKGCYQLNKAQRGTLNINVSVYSELNFDYMNELKVSSVNISTCRGR